MAKLKKCKNPFCKGRVIGYTRPGNKDGTHLYCCRWCWSMFPPSLHRYCIKKGIDPVQVAKVVDLLERPLRELSNDSGHSINTVKSWREKFVKGGIHSSPEGVGGVC